MIDETRLAHMDICRHLLPEPAPGVVGECIVEIRRLREALGLESAYLQACRDELHRLTREVKYLRHYGNKDCTALADEAMCNSDLD
jgi:hypothetical protein